jgi:ankyrin repeat protein
LPKFEQGKLLRSGKLWKPTSWLLDRGADPNLASLSGITALMLAIDDAEKVKLLIAKGADVKVKSREGQTALTMAVDPGRNADAVKLLLNNGAATKAGAGERDLLIAAARNADIRTLRLLLSKHEGEAPGGALSASAFSNCLECVRLLIKHGVAKQAINNALPAAPVAGSMEMLRELLAVATDVNARAGNGLTALMNATYREWVDPERVKLLLSRGANVHEKDSKGNTALSLAKQRGSVEIVKLLVDAGAKE